MINRSKKFKGKNSNLIFIQKQPANFKILINIHKIKLANKSLSKLTIDQILHFNKYSKNLIIKCFLTKPKPKTNLLNTNKLHHKTKKTLTSIICPKC